MLVIRIILFIALTANTKHDPKLSALFVGVTALPLVLLSCGEMVIVKHLILACSSLMINFNSAYFKT